MEHLIVRIKQVSPLRNYTIEVLFEDGTKKSIDLEPILNGPLFGPLRDTSLFQAVELDAETGVVQWPNGADLDPSTLFCWDECKEELAERALSW